MIAALPPDGGAVGLLGGGETWRAEATTVVLVDDDPDFRWVVRRALERTQQFDVIAEGANGLEGVELVLDHAPDVVVLDIEMPQMDGLEALGLVRLHRPETHAVMLTALSSSAQLDAAVRGGALGIIRKGSSLAGIVAQLRGLLDPGPGAEIALEGAV